MARKIGPADRALRCGSACHQYVPRLSFDVRSGGPPGSRGYPANQGVTSSIPMPAKSFSFLVAKDASLDRQIDAI